MRTYALHLHEISMLNAAGPVSFVLLLCMLLMSCVDHTPRDPFDVARQFSALEVPRSATIISFADDAGGMVGEDLWVKVEMVLSANEFAELESEAAREGYQSIRRPLTNDSIPIDVIDGRQNTARGYGTAVQQLAPGTEGLFKHTESDSTATTTVLLDRSRRRLWIFGYVR